MFDGYGSAAGEGTGAGDGFMLVAEELVRAAWDMRHVAQMVRDGWVTGLDDGVDVGEEELQSALGDFCGGGSSAWTFSSTASTTSRTG